MERSLSTANRSKTVAAGILLLASILACMTPSRAPESVLRGWTATPTSTATPMPGATPQPTIIYVFPTASQYVAIVRVQELEIRSGPGTKYPSNPQTYLTTHDRILVIACKYDDTGEAWANFYWAKKQMYGWAAVTYRGQIFLWPMPRECIP
jgi:hypothetical protein